MDSAIQKGKSIEMPKESYLLVVAPDCNGQVPGTRTVLLDSHAADSCWEQLKAEGSNWVNDPNSPISEAEVSLILEEARKIENFLLKAIPAIFNDIHRTDISPRGWSIMTGHWIRMFSSSLAYRKRQVDLCEKLYGRNGYLFVFHDAQLPPPLDTAESQEMFSQAKYNVRIYEHLLRHAIPTFAFPLFEDYVPDQATTNPRMLYRATFIEKVKGKLSLLIENYSKQYFREGDALIVNTYLPFWQELILNFKFHQFPRFPRLKPIPQAAQIDHYVREDFLARLQSTQGSKEFHGIMKVFAEFTPRIFLEEFASYQALTTKAPLPSKPRFIFTSNSFMTDEVFKFWTARQVDNGTPYFVGQHGNNYGTDRFLTPSIEEQTSSSFLTWGWKNSKSVPLFILKNGNPKQRKSSANLKTLLIIENAQDPHTGYWDSKAEFLRTAKDHVTLIQNLHPRVRNSTLVRLHSQNKGASDPQVLELRQYLEPLQFDYGNRQLKHLTANSRIVLHGYDSTGILETLSANIPTIALWRNGCQHVLPEVRPMYNVMFEKGIFFNDPAKASDLINHVWGCVDEWWYSEEIQRIRLDFCQEFARTSKKPIKNLVSAILELEKAH